MKKIPENCGIGTVAIHFHEGGNPHGAHVMPIYETSTFSFRDVANGQEIFNDFTKGYCYTRLGNPNVRHLAAKIAALEGFDLMKEKPQLPQEDVVAAEMFTSGMAAITAAISGYLNPGDTMITQDCLYGGTHSWMSKQAEKFGIKLVWLNDTSVQGWKDAFEKNPQARLAYMETPANPMMEVSDIAAVSEIAHSHDAWVVVDNTFATPCFQRPLTLGADVVVHSTTKYLSGMGATVGGAVVSRHPSYIRENVFSTLKTLGASPSPFDCWLTNMGLKTLELRMERCCDNAQALAEFFKSHPAVSQVFYPGLPEHPGHAIASRQMKRPGGMLSIELAGGFDAGVNLLENVKISTLAVSLGNLDTLIQHPASMTHNSVPRDVRLKMGMTDGLVRLAPGIENTEDLIRDFEIALSSTGSEKEAQAAS